MSEQKKPVLLFPKGMLREFNEFRRGNVSAQETAARFKKQGLTVDHIRDYNQGHITLQENPNERARKVRLA